MRKMIHHSGIYSTIIFFLKSNIQATCFCPPVKLEEASFLILEINLIPLPDFLRYLQSSASPSPFLGPQPFSLYRLLPVIPK
jgi:hypothetical protein